MARRKQFSGICHDVLETFLSRYNDLDGYWALGQYRSFLEGLVEEHIEFHLPTGLTRPRNPAFDFAAVFYHAAILRMMRSNAMPASWLSTAEITVSIDGPATLHGRMEIVSDLGRSYSQCRTLTVRAHDQTREHASGRIRTISSL